MRKVFYTLAAILLAAIISPSLSAYDFKSGDLYYKFGFDNKCVSVTYENSNEDNYSLLKGDVIVPATVDYNGQTYQVTEIGGYAFRYCSGITGVKLPSTIKGIREESFRNCTSLKSIDLPDGINGLDYKAFSGCSSLESVRLPNDITDIGKQSFYSCKSLKSIDLPNSVKTISDYAFYACSALTELQLPSSLGFMGNYSFSKCENLKTLKIIEGVTTLQNAAFYDCRLLQAIWLPSSLSRIEAEVFGNCLSIREIRCKRTRPAVIENTNCFDSSVYKLATVYIPNGYISVYCLTDGWEKFSNIEEENAIKHGDLNADGVINAADVSYLYELIMQQQ